METEKLNFDLMSPEEIENLRVEKEIALKEAQQSEGVLKDSMLETARQIIELRLRQKEFEIMHEKARHNVQALQSDIKILTSKFWQKRNT